MYMGSMSWEIGAQEICPPVLDVYSGGVLFGRALHPDFVLV